MKIKSTLALVLVVISFFLTGCKKEPEMYVVTVDQYSKQSWSHPISKFNFAYDVDYPAFTETKHRSHSKTYVKEEDFDKVWRLYNLIETNDDELSVEVKIEGKDNQDKYLYANVKSEPNKPSILSLEYKLNQAK